jgi:hypothetical protein
MTRRRPWGRPGNVSITQTGGGEASAACERDVSKIQFPTFSAHGSLILVAHALGALIIKKTLLEKGARFPTWSWTLPQTLNPWAVEKQPNPVYFKHLIPSVGRSMSTWVRHVPVDLAYLNFSKDKSIEYETVDANDTRQEDRSHVKTTEPVCLVEVNGMDDVEMEEYIQIEETEEQPELEVITPVAIPELPDKPAVPCSHCQLRFATLGQMKYAPSKYLPIQLSDRIQLSR